MLSVIYLAAMGAVAFPVWYSGLRREQESREAENIVRHVLEDKPLT